MSARLPFQDLLDALRNEGFPIGVHEHMALARLTQRYDGTSRTEFRAAVAALLGRNRLEVLRVQEVFDLLYPETPAAPVLEPRADPVPAQATRPGLFEAESFDIQDARPMLKRAILTGAKLAFLVLLPAVLTLVLLKGPLPFWIPAFMGGGHWGTPHLQPDGGVAESQPDAGPIESPDGGAGLPPVQPPRVPEVTPPTAFDWFGPGAFVVALAAAGFALAGKLQAEQVKARHEHSSWKERFDQLQGPRRYRLSPPAEELAPHPRILEQMANLLTRGSLTGNLDLDIRRTVEQSARVGRLPVLVFRRRRTLPPLIVLLDTSPEMEPWHGRIEALLQELEQQGVPLERWYFHRVPFEVARSTLSRRLPLEELVAQASHRPLLIVSCVRGLSHDEQSRAEELLEAWPVHAWLNPVTEQSLWAGFFRKKAEELPMWPMTDEGLLATARHLGSPERKADRPRKVESTGMRGGLLLRAMLLLAPKASFELAEALRRRFLPWASPDVVLELQQDLEMGFHRSRPEENRIAQAWLRAYDPDGSLHERVRHYLLQLMDGSRPKVQGSVADLRWQRDRALVALQLEHDREGRQWGEQTLRQLMQTELAAELKGDLGRLEAELPERVKPLLQELRKDLNKRGKATWRDWRWPGLAAAGLLAGVVAVTVWLSRSPLEKVLAFELEQQGGTLQVRLKDDFPPLPRGEDAYQLQLFRGGRALESRGLVLRNGQTELALEPADIGEELYVSAGVVGSRLLLSNTVVPAAISVKVDLVLPSRVLMPERFWLVRSGRPEREGQSGVRMQAEAGSWGVEILRNGARSTLGTIDVTWGGKNEFTFEVREDVQTGTLLITQVPPGYEKYVMVDRKPWSGGEETLTPGLYEVRLNHPFYDYSIQVEVTPGKSTTVALNRPAQYGVVAVRASPKTAQFIKKNAPTLLTSPLDGFSWPEDSKDEVTFLFRGAGKSEVTLTAPGREDRRVDLTFTAGRVTRQRAGELKRKVSQLPEVDLLVDFTIEGIPQPNVEYTLFDLAGTVKWADGTGGRIQTLPRASYLLTAQPSGFEPIKMSIDLNQVPAGKTHPVSIELKPVNMPVSLVFPGARPPDDSVYIDGKPWNQQPFSRLFTDEVLVEIRDPRYRYRKTHPVRSELVVNLRPVNLVFLPRVLSPRGSISVDGEVWEGGVLYREPGTEVRVQLITSTPSTGHSYPAAERIEINWAKSALMGAFQAIFYNGEKEVSGVSFSAEGLSLAGVPDSAQGLRARELYLTLPGTLSLRAQPEGFEPVSTQVEVKAYSDDVGPQTFQVSLKPAMVPINLVFRGATPPADSVFVDGAPWDPKSPGSTSAREVLVEVRDLHFLHKKSYPAGSPITIEYQPVEIATNLPEDVQLTSMYVDGLLWAPGEVYRERGTEMVVEVRNPWYPFKQTLRAEVGLRIKVEPSELQKGSKFQVVLTLDGQPIDQSAERSPNSFSPDLAGYLFIDGKRWDGGLVTLELKASAMLPPRVEINNEYLTVSGMAVSWGVIRINLMWVRSGLFVVSPRGSPPPQFSSLGEALPYTALEIPPKGDVRGLEAPPSVLNAVNRMAKEVERSYSPEQYQYGFVLAKAFPVVLLRKDSSGDTPIQGLYIRPAGKLYGPIVVDGETILNAKDLLQ